MASEKPSPLQIEIRQSRPFRSPAHEATVGLLRTADVLRQALAEVVEPAGLTPQQYNVLRILRGVADANDAGLPTLEIAERMVERAPGITRLLDRLEHKDLVRRERCEKDRRQVLCWPTAQALRVLAELDPVVDALEISTMSMLNTTAQLALIDALDTVRAARVKTPTGLPPTDEGKFS